MTCNNSQPSFQVATDRIRNQNVKKVVVFGINFQRIKNHLNQISDMEKMVILFTYC